MAGESGGFLRPESGKVEAAEERDQSLAGGALAPDRVEKNCARLRWVGYPAAVDDARSARCSPRERRDRVGRQDLAFDGVLGGVAEDLPPPRNDARRSLRAVEPNSDPVEDASQKGGIAQRSDRMGVSACPRQGIR